VSGHNKWSKIKRGKESKDKARGNIFSKFSRLITLAVIEGGGIAEPENNIKLRLAMEKAKAVGMPKDNINRAIEKAAGQDRSQLKEIVYEGFGPCGVALMIIATTDNANRTLTEIKNLLERNNGKLASQNSVAYLFKKCGLVILSKKDYREEKILDISDQISAFDISEDEENYYLYFPFENLGRVKEWPAEIDFKPQTIISLSEELTKKVNDLVNILEELDDVQKIFTNL